MKYYNVIRKYTALSVLCIWFGIDIRQFGLRPLTLEYEAIVIIATFGFVWIVEKLDKIK